MKYFDITTNGFSEKNAKNRIEILDNYWQELLEKQSIGGTIQAIDGFVYCLMPYEEIKNSEIVDISGTDKYKNLLTEQENLAKKNEHYKKIDELDKKRVRAICEPSIKDETTGQTWLEYYNSQVQELRNQINELG